MTRDTLRVCVKRELGTHTHRQQLSLFAVGAGGGGQTVSVSSSPLPTALPTEDNDQTQYKLYFLGKSHSQKALAVLNLRPDTAAHHLGPAGQRCQ